MKPLYRTLQILLVILMISTHAIAQKKAAKNTTFRAKPHAMFSKPQELKQGDCTWFIGINPNLKTYLHDHAAKCWYGTASADTIKVSANYEVSVNGKVVGIYGPYLNIFLGFDDVDVLSGRDKTDWIYGGPGHDTIYVTGTTLARGGPDADTFYSSSMDKSFIQRHILDNNFNAGDLVYPLYKPTEGQQTKNSQPTNLDNNGSSNCPCALEKVYVDGEGIINDYEYTRCPCEKVEIGSDDWVRSQGWDPMRH